MEGIASILAHMPMAGMANQEEHEKRRVEWTNSRPGKLAGYECKICMNRGYMAVLLAGEKAVRDCVCIKIRRSMKMLDRSGLKPLMKKYALENYFTPEPWQKNIKAKAMDFLKNPEGRWFGILGQTGSGKTHICTAIAVALLKMGKPVYYMLWNTDIKKLRATVNDGEAHEKEVEKLKKIDVLYIDDLFKCKHDSEPSDADVRLAFEILNARYNAQLTTLVSSEYSIDELCSVDAAIAGRLNEMGGRYVTNVEKNPSRDYRWEGSA